MPFKVSNFILMADHSNKSLNQNSAKDMARSSQFHQSHLSVGETSVQQPGDEDIQSRVSPSNDENFSYREISDLSDATDDFNT